MNKLLLFIITATFLLPLSLNAKTKFTLDEQVVKGRLQKPQAFFEISKSNVSKKSKANKKKISFFKRARRNISGL